MKMIKLSSQIHTTNLNQDRAMSISNFHFKDQMQHRPVNPDSFLDKHIQGMNCILETVKMKKGFRLFT